MAGTYQEGARQRPKREQKVIHVGKVDFVTAIVVALLVMVGVVMVFSAGYYKTATSADLNYDEFYFLKRQLMLAAAGFSIMVLVSGINYRFFMKFSIPLYVVSNFLVALVPIIGEEVNGAKRWIKVPIINQFQPSEVAKVAIIFVLSYIIYRNKDLARTFKGQLICMAFVLVSAVLVVLGNLSTAIIIGVLGAGIIFIASPHVWRFIGIAMAGVGAIAGVILFSPEAFRQERFMAWLDPFAYPRGVGYQIIQSLFAIASGGPFGLGIGQSRQKSFLPEPHNDFIFSIICEELGLFGAALVILLFLILIWRGISIAIKAPDLFGSLVASGIVLMLGSQAIINIAVVTNSMPNTGIPLPFISYGGTSLLINMFLMGVLLSISRYSKD